MRPPLFCAATKPYDTVTGEMIETFSLVTASFSPVTADLSERGVNVTVASCRSPTIPECRQRERPPVHPRGAACRSHTKPAIRPHE